MAVLPTAIVTVEIPDFFRPSQLPYADQCALRVVSVGHDVTRLPSGPQAARGRLAHEFLDAAARGAFPDPSVDGLRKELLLRVAALEEELRRDAATAAFARLEETVAPLEWRNVLLRLVRSAKRIHVALPVGAERQSRDAQFSARFVDSLPSHGFWTEFPITSAPLRLSGRIDALEMRGDRHVIVRDYKTGSTVDNRGQVREEIAKQLRLYGLVVFSLLPEARIDLIADDGTEHVVSFAEEDIARTRAWLSSVLARLPGRASVPALSLADPGPACGGCGIRHVCPAYRQVAPKLWKEGTVAMPMDIWGVVRTLSKGDDGTRTIELEDAAGRRVKIFRVDSRHEALRTAQAGDELWFFGLCGSATQGGDRLWRHPRNFWEVPGDSTQWRAWSLAVFSRATGC
jgi:hypothetical protein